MIGNWKWNFVVALVSALMTFLLSWQKNPLLTTMTRVLFTFVILFVAVYALRLLWGFALQPSEQSEQSEPSEVSSAGQKVDMATPDDNGELLKEMLSDPAADGPGAHEFVPLKPEKLVSTDNLDPEMLAKSVRHMSEE